MNKEALKYLNATKVLLNPKPSGCFGCCAAAPNEGAKPKVEELGKIKRN